MKENADAAQKISFGDDFGCRVPRKVKVPITINTIVVHKRGGGADWGLEMQYHVCIGSEAIGCADQSMLTSW